MVQDKLPLPEVFKGIALFTPGGDLVYCIDPHKQNRWHLQLCAVLQETLGLAEPPHFLLSCYTATIDRWLDPHTRQVHTVAEACPLVLRHQAILNAVFNTEDLQWQISPPPEELCDPMMLANYRQQFPALWQSHDLVVQFDKANTDRAQRTGHRGMAASGPERSTPGYVLRLFVSGHNGATEHILKNLHELLEQSLQAPYTLKVVDIYKHPELAEANQVAATPTLIRVWPLPVRRIIGNLENTSKVLQILSSPDL